MMLGSRFELMPFARNTAATPAWPEGGSFDSGLGGQIAQRPTLSQPHSEYFTVRATKATGRAFRRRMHSMMIALAILAAVVLTHLSYVDFRFRHRGGAWWYWLLGRAPPLMWVSRAAIVLACAVALSVIVFGVTGAFALLLLALLAVHIGTLVLLEARERR